MSPCDSLFVVDSFKVAVSYEQPTFAELEHRFPAYVNPEYRHLSFVANASGLVVAREPRVVTFQLMELSDIVLSLPLVAGLGERGVRPAQYEELIDVGTAHPELGVRHAVLGLGSVSLGRTQYIPFLGSERGAQALCVKYQGDMLFKGEQVLVVPLAV